jgi:hypothetical protein
MKKIARMFRFLAAALAVAVISVHALAVDRVTLKSGKVVEGTIVREVEGAIWIQTNIGGVVTEEMYGPSDITQIERDAAAPAAKADPTTPAAAKSDAAKPSGNKVPKAAIITLGDEENGNMVGVYMTAETLRRAIPLLEQELGTDHTGVVVLRFHSGGGMGLEVQKISDVIQNEYKTRWRTVGWIETAISAAAMSAHCLEEIYFTTQGNYGACVGFYSLSHAVEGFDLQKSLAEMERISARGGYNPLIMRAMQLQMPLSAHVDPNGEVKWYADSSSGDIIVNRPTEILTFNAVSAMRVKFSKGTADSLSELARAMGYKELDWVGVKEKNIPWPVCKAEKMQMDFRHQVHIDEAGTNSYYDTYRREVAAAASEPDPAERGKFIGKARQALEKIKQAVRNNPNFALTVFGGKENYDKFLEEQEALLRKLAKK